jgi:hypothetical protein
MRTCKPLVSTGRGLRSSTCRRKVTAVCAMRWVVSLAKATQVELRSGRVQALTVQYTKWRQSSSGGCLLRMTRSSPTT